MAVKIGDMDQVFEVQESVTAPDETGQDQESWRTLRKWKAALNRFPRPKRSSRGRPVLS